MISKDVRVGSEKGFTLVEVATAFMVLGVIVAVSIPIWSELREQQHLQTQRMQALLLLERQMEVLQASPLSSPQEGFTREQADGIDFTIHWEQQHAGSHLAETNVEVQWKDRRDKTQQLRLRAVQFVP
ncbi:type II secretion system protein [Desmospora activa]|uniref:Prepilin-type N-terminal cleavage/methylation domain-containing protein n=1 Tax=Desmospora activa DSM 45169 TaxID=1121389 RepID=A0A2T4ZBS1_9BACL|nr:type II secretion system protein [Desmospora activa]PTM59351.1 hypothetical protein C8J48_1964 [Desmospora activa DSM 45169]